MRLIIILLTILLFGIACGRKVPEGIVPQKQMEPLLLDMHLADGQLAAMPLDSARSYRDAYYGAIFNHYGIDSTTFERSIEFYSTRPELMKTMYANIDKRLEAYNTAEQRAIEEKYAEQRRTDSIANAHRTDSLRKVNRDSLDFKRKRYLLRLDGPDSLKYGQPIPVTYYLLRKRLFEAIGLRDVVPLDGHSAPETKPLSQPSTISPPQENEYTRPAVRPIKKIS